MSSDTNTASGTSVQSLEASFYNDSKAVPVPPEAKELSVPDANLRAGSQLEPFKEALDHLRSEICAQFSVEVERILKESEKTLQMERQALRQATEHFAYLPRLFHEFMTRLGNLEGREKALNEIGCGLTSKEITIQAKEKSLDEQLIKLEEKNRDLQAKEERLSSEGRKYSHLMERVTRAENEVAAIREDLWPMAFAEGTEAAEFRLKIEAAKDSPEARLVQAALHWANVAAVTNHHSAGDALAAAGNAVFDYLRGSSMSKEEVQKTALTVANALTDRNEHYQLRIPSLGSPVEGSWTAAQAGATRVTEVLNWAVLRKGNVEKRAIVR